MNIDQLIAEIRRVLETDGVIDEDRVIGLAREYDEVCVAINDRLGKCAGLLRKGLRSESIHAAELAPNVLEAATLLDFPEFEAWAQLRRDVGLPSPPAVDLDAAAALNEAYAEAEGLRSLMARHRRLALARAPLTERLSVLRAIAQDDPNNTVWQDDLRQWEHACFQQMAEAGNRALKRKDRATLVELVSQLQTTPWTENPPVALMSSLTAAEAKISRNWAREQLERLEPAINTAYAEMDLEESRRLRNQWDEQNAIAQLPATDPLVERISPAVEWLDEQNQRAEEARAHQQAIHRLEQALDKDTKRADLERLFHAVEMFDADVPAALRERFRARLESLDVAAKRKFLLLVGVVVTVLGLVAFGSWSLISSRQFAAAVTKNSQTLAELLDQEKLSEAREFANRLAENEPDVAASPEVSQLVVSLDAAEQAEASRRDQFNRAAITAESSAETPAGQGALNEARRLAKTDDERGRVARIERGLQEARAERQRLLDSAFAEQLQQYAGRLDAIGQLKKSDPNQRQTAEQLLGELQTFTAQSQNVSVSVRESARPIEQRLTTLIAESKRREAEASALFEVLAAAGNIDGFQRSLKKYAEENAGSARALDMQAVIEEAELWKGLLAWSRLAERWDGESREALGTSRARFWVAQFEELIANHGASPFQPIGAANLATLKKIAQRVELARAEQLASYRSQFRSGVFDDVTLVVLPDETRQYVKMPYAEFQKTSGDKTMDVIQDISGKITKLQRPSGSQLKKVGVAPQSVIAPKLYELLADGLDDHWDERFIEFIKTVNGQDDLDPILKVSLLKDTLYLAAEGNPAFRTAFRSWNDAFNAPELDVTVQWIAPGNAVAEKMRKRCEAALAGHGTLDEALKKLSEANEAALQSFESSSDKLTSYRWQGVLLRDDDGAWQCRLTSPPETPVVLSTIVKNELGEATLVDLGTATPTGEVTFSGTENRYREGRPVFARAVPQPSASGNE